MTLIRNFKSIRVWLPILGMALGAADAQEPEQGGVDAGAPARLETLVRGDRGLDPRRVAGSAQVLTAEQLERRESNDIHRVLEEVPGVYVREEDGFGLRPNIGLRGAQADRSSKIALLEDGLLFAPAPYSAPAAYYFPLVTRMTAVEVYKGPAAIRFGPQTVGGAINLRTREVPEGLASELDLSAGLYRSLKAHGWVGFGSERSGVLIEGIHVENAGFKQLDGGGPTGFARNELTLKGWARAGPGRLTLKVGYGDEASNETYLGLSETDFKENPYRRYLASSRDRMTWHRFSGALSYALPLTTGVSVNVALYRNDFSRTWVRMNGFRGRQDLSQILAGTAAGPTAGYLDVLRGDRDSLNADEDIALAHNRRRFVSEGAQATLLVQGSTGPIKHEIEMGLRFHHDEIKRLHTQEFLHSTGHALVPTGEGESITANEVDFARAFAGWVTDTLSFGRLLVAPGLRIEHVVTKASAAAQSQTQLAVLPGLGAVVALPFDLDLLAGVHRGYSPVVPGQVGTAEPEFAWNVEAGARLSRRRLKLEVVGFVSDYSNLLGTCTLSTGCTEEELNRQFNGGRVVVYGVEALARTFARLPKGLKLSAGINYTFSGSNFLSDFISGDPSWGVVRAGDTMPFIPAHRGAVTVGLEHDRFEVGVGLALQSEMRQVAGSDTPRPSERIPGHALLDAYATFHATTQISLYATATNLTNQAKLVARAPFGARPLAPLQAQLGLKVAFR